jgi:magnesium and cobalt exporter, CNNM family
MSRPNATGGRVPGPFARGLARVVVRVADGLTRAVNRLLGTGYTAGRESITEAELRDLVAVNVLLDREERRIIGGVLAVAARHVREVMVPRTEVLFLDAALSLPAAVALTSSARHSRFPVIDGSHDDVVGFVHLRDLLIRPPGDTAATVGELSREVRRLPASKRVLAALSEMRREGRHLAVVVDEYGGTAGIVTLEDLIEELVGEIHDEYDLAPDPEPAEGTRPSEVDGLLNLGDFADVMGFALPPGPYETLGGFVMARLGRLPEAGDEVREAGWRLVVAALDGRRVARVAVAPVPQPPPPAAVRAAGVLAGAEPARADRSGVEPARAEPARAEPARAEPARAEPARADRAGAEPAGAAGLAETGIGQPAIGQMALQPPGPG